MVMTVITTCLSTFNISGCCTVRKHFLYHIHRVFSNAEVSRTTILNKINKEPMIDKHQHMHFFTFKTVLV